MISIERLAFVLAMIGLVGLEAYYLRKKFGGSVHVVWYLFSFSLCVGGAAFSWASHIGAIDATGNPSNEYGRMLISIFGFFLDLNQDFWFLVGVVFVVIGPQFLSYCASGLFGCAARPRFVAQTINFFTWGMVKSFASGAGAFLSAALFGLYSHWHGFEPPQALKYGVISSMLMVVAFLVLMAKATTDELPTLANDHRIKYILRRLLIIHAWMMRNRNPS